MANRSILITGASTGIGAASAIEFARRGWHVFAAVRSTQAGEALRHSRPNVDPLILDVTSPVQIASAAEYVRSITGEAGLGALVNNAGIAVQGPLEIVPIEDLRRQFEVNVTGLLAVTQAMLPLLRLAGGRIINISSVSGLVAYPFLGPYAASKHAVEAISDALRAELSPWNIHVALIEPGAVATPIWDKARRAAELQTQAVSAEHRTLYRDYFQVVAGKIADAERYGIPAERVADAVYHAAAARRPKARYPLGPGSHLARLRRYLPDRLWDALVRRQLARLRNA